MNNFLFHYKGQKKIYIVTIQIEGEEIKTDCSCSSRKPCRHIHNILIGRTEKIKDDEAGLHKKMTEAITQVPAGKKVIEFSRAYFQNEEVCRRCNSTNIVDTKANTIFAKLYRVISRHRYYCKDCRWSW